MTVHRCWFAVLEYRPDPTSDEGRVPLAVLMEVQRNGKWIVGFAVKTALGRSERERLDSIASELLKDPSKFLESAIDSVLAKGARGGEALSRIADEYQWSFAATPPKKHEIRGKAFQSLGQQLDAEMRRLYAEHVAGVPVERLPQPSGDRLDDDYFVPPPKMSGFREVRA
jgi:hypothetical protein